MEQMFGGGGEEFGSNADRQEGLEGPDAVEATPTLQAAASQAPKAEVVAQPEAPKAAAEAPKAAGESEEEKKKRLAVFRTLKTGRKGDDVKALQAELGLEGDKLTGTFGKDTKEALKKWQADKKLGADGVAGKRTIAEMRGDDYIYGYDWHHDPDKFVPKYPMTAYHESGVYRDKDDPYAVGAITNPDKEDDIGGKTYGTYQFESYHYPDGTKNKKNAPHSTAQRFVDWEDNPYGEQFKKVVEEHGMASDEFDALWTKLAGGKNKAFGSAQEQFLEHDKKDYVDKLLKTAGASDKAKKDPRLFDLMLGTGNQYGGLASGHAKAAADKQKAAGKTFSSDELAKAVQDSKKANVTSNFSSSPGAWKGIRSRIKAERGEFE